MTDFGIPTPLKAQCSLTGYEDSDDERGDESVQNSSFSRNVSELLDFVNRELMPNQLHNFGRLHRIAREQGRLRLQAFQVTCDGD